MFRHTVTPVQESQILPLREKIASNLRKSCTLSQLQALIKDLSLLAKQEFERGNTTQALQELMNVQACQGVLQHWTNKKIPQGVPDIWLRKLKGKEITMSDGTTQISNDNCLVMSSPGNR